MDLIGYSMTSAKNVDLLSDVRSKAYLVWVSQVDAYLTEKFPYSAHLFKTTADEQRVQIEWEVPGNEAADVDANTARFIELQQHDEAAKAHVLQYITIISLAVIEPAIRHTPHGYSNLGSA